MKIRNHLIYSIFIFSVSNKLYICRPLLTVYFMKKISMLIAASILAMPMAFAGGILTNGNQSAQYIRMLSRNASTQIDGVYFNPAGLTQLENGFHFSLSNQSIFQNRTIENTYPLLNQETYDGGVTIPFFPNAYAVYKKDKLAFSMGFGVNAGGGTVEYKNGLPSFEMPIATVLKSFGATGYTTDLYFKGYSAFMGYQFNASYKFCDFFSASAGVRLIDATNKYKGHITDIYAISGSNVVTGETFLQGVATSASAAATAFAQYPASAVMPDNVAASAGLPSGTTFGVGAATMSAIATQATYYSTQMGDKYVDAKQKGFGVTPVLGVDFKPTKGLNIGARYEFRTKLELENQTKVDDINYFPDGETYRNDIPAILAVGVDYKLFDNVKVSGSYTNYFDKNANWDGKEENVDNNLYECALGMEYQLSEVTAISAGYMRTQTGVGRAYQTDMNYSLVGNSVGMGMMFKVNPKFDLDLGFLYTAYTSDYKEGTYNSINYKESYDKTNLAFSIGVTYHLFK